MRVLFVFFAFLFVGDCLGQNLVPNASFEDTIACPTSDNQVYNALGWSNYSNQSPDYFNSCTSYSYIDIPNNWGGYQVASSGNAYCAISGFYPSTPNQREIIGRNLSSSMVIGTKYFFSMKVNLSIDTFISSSYACNKLGVKFSTTPYNSSQPIPINNDAHIWTDSIITDTLNWTTVFGSFIAGAAYNYLALGNFFDDANTDTLKMINGTPWDTFAYYYIDDICVSIDSAYCQNYVYTTVPKIPQDENRIIIYPNPTSNYLTIDSRSQSPNMSLFIYDLTGKIIKNERLEESYINTISLINIPNGIYVLQINIDNSIYRQKIIINH